MAYNNSMASSVIDASISNMFTTNPVNLAAAVGGTTGTAVLTASTTTGKLKVTAIRSCEYGGAGTTVTLRLLPSGGTEGAVHDLINALSIGSGVTLNLLEQLDGPIVLDVGDKLTAFAGTTARANIVITYESENGVEA